MQHITKALPDVQQGLPARVTNAKKDSVAIGSTEPAIRQRAMRRLWERMAAIFGHRWTSSFGDSAEDSAGTLTVAGETWRRGLIGLAEVQIGVGIEACITASEPWPPTLPEFRAMCLGVPSFPAAVRQFQNKSVDRTPFARLMWQHIDGWQFGQANTRDAERILRGAYEIAREHVMRGGALPEPSIAIENAKPREAKPASPEVVKAAMDKIAAAIGVSDACPGHDLAAAEAELGAHYGTGGDAA